VSRAPLLHPPFASSWLLLLPQEISDFINARIYIADQLIVNTAVAKVVAGDVILTYAYSHVVAEVLLEAAKRRKEFRVVVVDARPETEGRQMMQVREWWGGSLLGWGSG
jgi:translation initiation factor 2B subunit (eIF-2B alpha/beta/delta family)